MWKSQKCTCLFSFSSHLKYAWNNQTSCTNWPFSMRFRPHNNVKLPLSHFSWWHIFFSSFAYCRLHYVAVVVIFIIQTTAKWFWFMIFHVNHFWRFVVLMDELYRIMTWSGQEFVYMIHAKWARFYDRINLFNAHPHLSLLTSTISMEIQRKR